MNVFFLRFFSLPVMLTEDISIWEESHMFKIIVVEDDRELNRAVCSFLNQNGYEAHGCLSANEAYDAMYGGNVFDLII